MIPLFQSQRPITKERFSLGFNFKSGRILPQNFSSKPLLDLWWFHFLRLKFHTPPESIARGILTIFWGAYTCEQRNCGNSQYPCDQRGTSFWNSPRRVLALTNELSLSQLKFKKHETLIPCQRKESFKRRNCNRAYSPLAGWLVRRRETSQFCEINVPILFGTPTSCIFKKTLEISARLKF